MGYYDQGRERRRSKAKLLGRPKLPKMRFGPMLAGDVSGALSDQIGEFMRKGCWLVIGATECFIDCPGQVPGGAF